MSEAELDPRAWIPMGPVSATADMAGMGTFDAESRLAAVAQCAPPPTDASALGRERMRQRTMSSTAAVSLGLPVGSIAADADGDVFLQEHSRTVECDGPEGQRVLYGVSVRLVVEFTSTTVDVKAGLPTIAAAVQLGYTSANVLLDVVGYPPGVPAEFMLDWAPITVESYADIFEKVNGLRRHVFADTANLRPERLGLVAEPPPGADRTAEAIGHLWAIERIAEGESCAAALRRLTEAISSERASGAARAVYEGLAGDAECSDRRPDQVARARADQARGRFRLRVPGPFGT